jgi:hypothetical protein
MPENETPTTSAKRIAIHMTVGQAWVLAVTTVSVLSGAFGFGWSASNWNSSGKIAALEVTLAERDRNIGDVKHAHDKSKVEYEQLKTKEAVLRLFYFYHLAKLKEERARADLELAQKSLDGLIPLDRPVFPASAFLPDEVRAMREERLREYEKNYREYYQGLTDEQRAKVDGAQSALAQAKESLATAKGNTYEAGKGFEALIFQEEGRAKDLEITLAHISKGGGGVGTIKFAYDGTSVDIPNEFLPKAAN